MSKTIGIYKLTSNYNTEEAFKLIGASSQIEVCTRDYMNWCKKGKAPKTMQAEFDRAIKETAATEPSVIFKVDILKAVETLEALEAAKAEFGLGNKGGKPKGDKPAKTPKADKTALTPEEALAKMGTLAPAVEPTVEPEPVIENAGEDEACPPFGTSEPEPVGVPVAFVEEVIGEKLTLKVSAKLDYKALFDFYKAGKSVKDICEENGISKSTFYKNTAQYK